MSQASLDIVLLRTFLAVVESGGFAAAAERLALTPSAVSGHIKRLEQATQSRLLARTTRTLQLTPPGELLVTYARNIIGLEREARARLSGSTISGRLRIGASEDFAGSWLPQVLETFHRWYPQASVELRVGVTADLVRQLQADRLDVVFGKQCMRVAEEGELLWQEELVWAYGAHCPFDIEGEVPLAAFPEPCVYREAAMAALSQAARAWRLVFESSSMAGCVAAARAGFAVAPVARSQLREGLRTLDAEDGMPPLPNACFYAFANPGSSAARALIAQVKEIGWQRRFTGLGL
ncbi:LysR family transcriptional regulator [Halomonas salipaludis]|uniref:LysR family transcriptional regulator n=1 Tax=Halomonas salipaludis TaxID=2032625 RepID=A0A2A2ETC2_9GAMM|nr:LysR family transcriptional regulator [Halomonas salipaludis]PAU75553.1 LysR family transcriptional regulator [Halomonas salipaludis]